MNKPAAQIQAFHDRLNAAMMQKSIAEQVADLERRQAAWARVRKFIRFLRAVTGRG